MFFYLLSFCDYSIAHFGKNARWHFAQNFGVKIVQNAEESEYCAPSPVGAQARENPPLFAGGAQNDTIAHALKFKVKLALLVGYY